MLRWRSVGLYCGIVEGRNLRLVQVNHNKGHVNSVRFALSRCLRDYDALATRTRKLDTRIAHALFEDGSILVI